MQRYHFSRRDVLKMSGAAAVCGVFAQLLHSLPAEAAPDARPDARPDAGRSLVAYFSMPETDKPGNMTREEENSTVIVNGRVLGNTQYVAELIQDMTGSDIFRILPEKPYPKEHRALVALAKKEQEENARPAIAGTIAALESYGTIFIGYPNWWADMPMILYTFLEQYDFSGKTIIPFCTHGGSGLSGTVRSIQEKQPKAKVVRTAFCLSRSRMEEAPESVAQWLKKIGYKL